ncbi:hypothetical protein BJY24_001719 [Nocardia transvalensis]|uniref:YbaB/EbfC DNA-binding family protein n=1 Tax=Nocardia transvalensis TaxID=37333 RepID=A0A7W9PB67_9NOCA|nr:hypothetical protein [Nocardia transvalensis]MBB5912852.1 hypothetical protein [Nocardia transvalensis]
MTGEQFAPEEWSATSRTGSITVRTTEQGLPVGISVEPGELRKDPRALATEVVRLCRQAANRAGLQRRAQLEEAGMAPEMIDLMGLPTPEAVARQEVADEEEYETEPDTWLRSV